MKKTFFFSLVPLLIIFDQVSKWFVSEHFIRGTEPMGLMAWLMDAPDRLPYGEVAVLPFFNFVMVWNKGISFGLFNNETDYGPLILIVLSLLVTIWFGIWLTRCQNKMQCAGLVLVISGAVGNMIDRMRFGAVADFLDFHVFGYHWPAFNVADSCIVVGVVILMIHALFFEKTLHERS